MIEPTDENRIGLSEHAAQIPIPASAPVPRLIESGPLRIIVIAVVVRRRGGGLVQRPTVSGVAKNAAFHRKADSRCKGGRRGDCLERGRRSFRRRPWAKGTISVAVHTYTAVAPGLTGDPGDHGARIVAIMLEGK